MKSFLTDKSASLSNSSNEKVKEESESGADSKDILASTSLCCWFRRDMQFLTNDLNTRFRDLC
jgi:hypothetical protein